MKQMADKIMIMAMLCLVGMASAASSTMSAPDNPATGIWIQQKGDIVPHDDTKATLYYTKFANYKVDAVKSLQYYYNGAGYLQLLQKDTLCGMNDGMKGSDGIVHHPGGDLLVAGQGQRVHKVSKTAKNEGGKCLVKTVDTDNNDGGVWHLMMDPNQKWLWAAGIPGYLRRIGTYDAANDYFGPSYYVPLTPNDSDRVQHHSLSTLIWDEEGNAFFTYSDYMGGGCETDTKGISCDTTLKKKYRANSYFGYITDTTWTKVTSSNQSTVGGSVGDSVITGLGTAILIDSLEGAHGGTYDSFSKTIFVFGGARIVQIKPYIENKVMKAKVVAYIDLREYFFEESEDNLTQPRTPSRSDGNTACESGFTPSVGWRLDQGTVDGMGHLFVASNTGHLVFVDYAANPNKYINDNVLVHLQWIDNYLDDLAPLSGVGVVRKGASTGEDSLLSSSSGMSSSMVVYSCSSTEKSSSSVKSSSSSATSSSSSAKSSSSLVVYSSSTKSSSSSAKSSSSAASSSSTTSGSSTKSSSSTGASSSSTGSTSSSSKGNSSSSGADDSSSSGKSSSSTGGSTNSSSSGTQGSGEDFNLESSSSNRYVGFDDYDLSSDSGLDFYPSQDKLDDGDSVVNQTVVLIPVDSAKGTEGTVTIGENTYLLTNNPEGAQLDLRYNSEIDSAQVGQLIAITLDEEKLAEIFGTSADSLTIFTRDLTIIDPLNPQQGDTIKVNNDGDVTIWVTSDEAIRGGTINVADANGKVIIIDNINFYDPIPDADKGYIKDSDGDEVLDFLEIVLKDTLEAGLSVYSVDLVVNGDTLHPASVPELNSTVVNENSYETKTVNTISLSVSDVKLPDEFPEDAYAIITYTNSDDVHYTRLVSVSEIGSKIIESAYAIRDSKGKDSLFVKFNVDLIPADLSEPEMLLMIKQNAKQFGFVGQISNVYMPTKNLVILVGDSLGLLGEKKDSVSLYPNVTFHNLPYITSDEYDREVPVEVRDRLPSAVDVEYWDTDGDGMLDQIVTNFEEKLTPEEVSMLYMTFPWYSDRGMLIQLQAQPEDLALSKDSMSVVWNVFATSQLASGVTSISESLPMANVYTYYDVLGETFVNEEAVSIVDKMSPVVSAATLSYGSKADTLTIVFSEAILYQDLDGTDYFSYIHGKDTIDILPMGMDWAQDGKSVKLILDGSIATILPGDSLMVVKGAKDDIRDNYGNVAGENPQAVVIAGLLNHLVETTKMGSFDATDDRVLSADDSNSYTLQTVSSVNLRYVPGSTTKEDMEKEGALGQLVQLGERFVPQLLDRAQISADGTVDPSVLDSLDPAKVYITFVVNYYDHLGQYVNDTTIIVPCNSPKFGGNCLSSDQKVFVNWNFKDHTGRFVGSGVYMVQFKMVVRYEKKKIEEEIKDKWGVRRKKVKR